MSPQDDELQRHCLQTLARNGSTASSVNKRKGSPCSEDGYDDSQADKMLRYPIPDLPEVSSHPHPDSLRSKAHAHELDFSRTIDRILRKHSGVCLKILKLVLFDIAYRDLDDCLQVAVKPGIEELTVMLCRFKTKYDFPCPLLSEGIRNSIRILEVGFCAFHPAAELGTLTSLRSLRLFHVRIEDDELEGLLSNSPVLELLDIAHCNKTICLKLPCVLERLIFLKATTCRRLRMIENRTPNLSRVCYSRVKLPSIMPNLETLAIRSGGEVVNTPMLPTKFVHLKHLDIFVISGRGLPYDYFSLVSFLDVSPSLETLSLGVSMENKKHESVIGHSSQWRQMDEHPHCSLKSVKITGFSSAKSLVELTCYILKNAVSLDCLRLDTLYGSRCSDENYDRCQSMNKGILTETSRGGYYKIH